MVVHTVDGTRYDYVYVHISVGFLFELINVKLKWLHYISGVAINIYMFHKHT